MIDSLRSRAAVSTTAWSSWTPSTDSLRSAGVTPERRQRSVTVGAYVNRRPQRPRSTGYRPPSPSYHCEEPWQTVRSRSPSVPRAQAPPTPVSPQLDQDFERLISKFRLRRTQKRQMNMFLEMGLSMTELEKLLKRRAEVLNYRPATIKKKVRYLMEYTYMTRAEFKKFFLKFPRILEYSMKKTVQPRLNFLLSIGCEKTDLAKILIQAPAVTELSVENTLAPRVEYLRDVIGIRSELLRKTLLKKPQLLTYSQESMDARVAFLQEWNMSATDITTVVSKHPQILHYSVHSMSEHIRYLLHVGIERNSIRRIIVRFPQILSLDLKVNVIPKVRYLCSELGGTTETLENNPVFVGLSLKKRIIPRHRFLSSLSVDVRPMPMNWFKCSDAVFANSVAKVPLEQFIAFKEQCLMEL